MASSSNQVVLLVSKAYLDNFSTDLNLMASNLASQGGSLECVILHPLSSPSQVGMEDMTPSVDNHGISSYDLNRINCAFASEDLQFNFVGLLFLGLVLTLHYLIVSNKTIIVGLLMQLGPTLFPLQCLCWQQF